MKRYILLFEIMQDDCTWNEKFIVQAVSEEDAVKKCKLRTPYYKLLSIMESE